MKKLDLKQIGVQELTFAENSQIDGGFILAAIAVGLAIAIIAAPIIAWSDDDPNNDHFNGMP